MAQLIDRIAPGCCVDRHAPDEMDADLSRATQQMRERRARLRAVVATQCEPGGACQAPRPCEGYDSIAEVLDAVGQAEEHATSVVARLMRERATMRQLVVAAARVGAIDDLAEMEAIIPELALVICGGCDAALVQLQRDGSVAVLSSSGAPFELPASVGALAATDAGGALLAQGRPAAAGGAPGGIAEFALAHGAMGAVLVLHWGPGCAGPNACEREHLAVYASLAGAALARARASAALHEAASRDAATLAAIRDGVVAVDGDGVVRALNDAGAAALGVAREQVLGRRLRDVTGLAPLAQALASAPNQLLDVVTLPRGDVTVRSQRYDGGVVATLRDVATEHTIAQKMVGSVARYTFDQLVGAAPGLRDVIEDAKQVARSDIPVLICGESGTGKEMLAQAIHNASPRASGPFLGINVTAIPRELLESELFGYEGGTFTGARAAGRAGKFELAGNGTLLLDEIGDMPLEMQSKLLRVLQERVVQRLGSARDIQVRARIIATTHHDLLEAVNAGRFRLDLYHRLCVFHLRLAPLRERHEDVRLIVEHHLRLHCERTGRRVRIAPDVLAALQAYPWPGNVRELLNVLEGELSVLRDGGDVLSRIPPALQQRHAAPPVARAALGPLVTASASGGGRAEKQLRLEELERRACEESLAAHRGNVARAARALGVAKSTLYVKMKRYGLVPSGGTSDDPARPLAAVTSE